MERNASKVMLDPFVIGYCSAGRQGIDGVKEGCHFIGRNAAGQSVQNHAGADSIEADEKAAQA